MSRAAESKEIEEGFEESTVGHSGNHEPVERTSQLDTSGKLGLFYLKSSLMSTHGAAGKHYRYPFKKYGVVSKVLD